MILLHDFEAEAMIQRTLKGMNLTPAVIDQGALSECVQEISHAVSLSLSSAETQKAAASAYSAWLGFYNGHTKDTRWDKPRLVNMANQFAATIGFEQPPEISAETIGKMGLKGVPGLRIDKSGKRR
jgi:hypothetical protein